MRMRKKKHGAERIAACSELLIEDISALKNGFEGVFPDARPVHLEIGCGKGNFACGMAEKYPEVYAACGIHPEFADEATDENIEKIRKMCKRHHCGNNTMSINT